ncbi:MAG: hypothetical protein ACK53Y_13075 [bacterium]
MGDLDCTVHDAETSVGNIVNPCVRGQACQMVHAASSRGFQVFKTIAGVDLSAYSLGGDSRCFHRQTCTSGTHITDARTAVP